MAHDDDEKEEEWSPEDDKIEHKFIKRIMKKMDQEERKEEEREKASKEARDKLYRVPKQTLVARGIPPPGMGYGTEVIGGLVILIRPIENGFIISYTEVVRPPEPAAPLSPQVDSREVPQYVTSESLGGPSYISVRKVEVFVKDSAEAVSVVGKAMDAARALHKLQNEGESAFIA